MGKKLRRMRGGALLGGAALVCSMGLGVSAAVADDAVSSDPNASRYKSVATGGDWQWLFSVSGAAVGLMSLGGVYFVVTPPPGVDVTASDYLVQFFGEKGNAQCVAGDKGKPVQVVFDDQAVAYAGVQGGEYTVLPVGVSAGEARERFVSDRGARLDAIVRGLENSGVRDVVFTVLPYGGHSAYRAHSEYGSIITSFMTNDGDSAVSRSFKVGSSEFRDFIDELKANPPEYNKDYRNQERLGAPNLLAMSNYLAIRGEDMQASMGDKGLQNIPGFTERLQEVNGYFDTMTPDVSEGEFAKAKEFVNWFVGELRKSDQFGELRKAKLDELYNELVYTKSHSAKGMPARSLYISNGAVGTNNNVNQSMTLVSMMPMMEQNTWVSGINTLKVEWDKMRDSAKYDINKMSLKDFNELKRRGEAFNVISNAMVGQVHTDVRALIASPKYANSVSPNMREDENIARYLTSSDPKKVYSESTLPSVVTDFSASGLVSQWNNKNLAWTSGGYGYKDNVYEVDLDKPLKSGTINVGTVAENKNIYGMDTTYFDSPDDLQKQVEREMSALDCEPYKQIELPSPKVVEDCEDGSVSWDKPADSVEVSWTLTDSGNLVATANKGYVFPDGKMTHDYGVASKSVAASNQCDKPENGKPGNGKPEPQKPIVNTPKPGDSGTHKDTTVKQGEVADKPLAKTGATSGVLALVSALLTGLGASVIAVRRFARRIVS